MSSRKSEHRHGSCVGNDEGTLPDPGYGVRLFAFRVSATRPSALADPSSIGKPTLVTLADLNS